MKQLSTLLFKEIKALRTVFLFLVLITVAVDLYGYLTGSPTSLKPALSLLPYLGLIFLLPAILFYSFNSEWRNTTVYLLFSLPINHYWIPILKTLAILLISIPLFIISSAGVYINYLAYYSNDLYVSPTDFWAFFSINYFILQFFLLSVVTLSESIKFSFHRARGLFATLTFVIVVYIFLRLEGLGHQIFGFLPTYHINVVVKQGNLSHYPNIHLSNVVYPVVFSIITLLLSCLIFEKKVDV